MSVCGFLRCVYYIVLCGLVALIPVWLLLDTTFIIVFAEIWILICLPASVFWLGKDRDWGWGWGWHWVIVLFFVIVEESVML